ncbi:MAG TPA: MFS transporter [Acidimicrobiia bacterium]|nr:MFS transporter [Acidimicrobiia bacterium]
MDRSPPPVRAPTKGAVYDRRWWILAVLCFSLVVITLDNTILNVALPTLVRDLHANDSELQWMVDSYTLVFAGLLLSAGSLGDRFGRRGALQLGLAIFGVGSLLSALVSTPTELIATRALMGVGGAFIMPSTLSILTNVFTDEERGRAIGVWAGVAGIGIAIGPLAGGILLEHFAWGSIFLVNIPIVVVAIAAGQWIVPTSKDPRAPKLDVAGAVLSIAGLFLLLYAIIDAPSSGWTAPRVLGAFGLSAALLAAFVVWELRSRHPMLNISFFENPRFTAASASLMLVFFALFGATFLLTQYFQFVLGYSALKTGVALLPFAAAIMVVAPLSARVAERIGTKITVSAGLFVVAAGLALFSRVRVDTPYLDLLWRMLLMSGGMGLTMTPATDSIMGSLPLENAGVGSAVNDTTRQVGGALGVAVIGSLLASGYGSRVGSFLHGKPVPPAVAKQIRHQVGAALAVAHRVGGAAGDALAHHARSAFVSGLHSGVLVGAAAALLGAVITAAWLPARAKPPEHRDEPPREDRPAVTSRA